MAAGDGGEGGGAGAGAAEAQLEDLIGGANEWRNIQEIVRLTFRAFHDVLRGQAEAVRALEARLEKGLRSKVGREQVRAMLPSTEGVAGESGLRKLTARLEALESAVKGKSDAREVARDFARRPTKSELREAVAAGVEPLRERMASSGGGGADAKELRALRRAVGELREKIEGKADMDQVEILLETKAGVLEVGQILDEKAGLAALVSKVDAEEFDERLSALKAGLRSDMADRPLKLEVDQALGKLRREVQEAQHAGQATFLERLSGKADWKAAEEIREKAVTDICELRENLREVSLRLEESNTANSAAVRRLGDGYEATVKDLWSGLQDARARIDERAGPSPGESGGAAGGGPRRNGGAASEALEEHIAEVKRLLESKADAEQVAEALREKASIAAMKKSLEQLNSESGPVTRQDLWQVKDELATRAGMEDVCALLDTKANICDVNSALDRVDAGIAARVQDTEFQSALHDQSLLNASLCSEHSAGRWLWKSRKTRSGGGVPWNYQTVNTDPENYLWEPDRVHITLANPGLYEVTFGFFCRKKPSVQLLVNGEPVLAAVNTASYVVHHSSGRLTSSGRHPNGNITGLTLIDFLSLPADARVALTYKGEGGEGFLSLKKL